MKKFNVIIGIVVVLLISVIVLQAQGVRGVDREYLLIEARLERASGNEVVSKVRFIVEAGIATAVFLPSSERFFGVGLSFVPSLSGRGEVNLFSMSDCWRFWEPGLSMTEESIRANAQASSSTTRGGQSVSLGQDRTILKDAGYVVILNCKEIVDKEQLKHSRFSIYQYKGEQLQRTNVALPQLMSVGVELNLGEEAQER